MLKDDFPLIFGYVLLSGKKNNIVMAVLLVLSFPLIPSLTDKCPTDKNRFGIWFEPALMATVRLTTQRDGIFQTYQNGLKLPHNLNRHF